MFRLLFIFVILAAGLYFSPQFVGQDPFITLIIAPMADKLILTRSAVFFITLILVVLIVNSVLKRGLRSTNKTWGWFGARKLKRARLNTNQGMIKLLEGDWKVAEKNAIKSAKYHDMPLLCYLIASEAAYGMGDIKKSQQYLRQAEEEDQDMLVIEITRIRQLLRTNQFNEAHSRLENLRGQHPNNSIVLNLLKKTYVALGLWRYLDDLLPKLEKNKLISNTEKQELFYQSQYGKLAEEAELRGLEGVLAYWNCLPRKLKHDTDIVCSVVQQLVHYKEDDKALSILKDRLKKSPSNELLLALVPTLQPTDHKACVALLANIIRNDRSNAAASSALGQIYLQKKDWAPAQQAFEHALSVREDVSDFNFLATSLEQQDMTEAAGDVSRKALNMLGQTKA